MLVSTLEAVAVVAAETEVQVVPEDKVEPEVMVNIKLLLVLYILTRKVHHLGVISILVMVWAV